MIMVDVEVFLLDRIYDFELDENAAAGEVKEKIIKLIEENLKIKRAEGEEMELYALRQEKILNDKMTSAQQGVQNGDRLVLI